MTMSNRRHQLPLFHLGFLTMVFTVSVPAHASTMNHRITEKVENAASRKACIAEARQKGERAAIERSVDQLGLLPGVVDLALERRDAVVLQTEIEDQEGRKSCTLKMKVKIDEGELKRLAIRLRSKSVQGLAIGAIIRVMENGSAVNTASAGSLQPTKSLQNHLGQNGFDLVDMTPLHDDFARLRFTNECPYTDGISWKTCETPVSFAEGVMRVIYNTRASIGLAPALAPFQDCGGFLVIGNLDVTGPEAGSRIVNGSLTLTVRRVSDDASLLAYTETISDSVLYGGPSGARDRITDEAVSLGATELARQLPAILENRSCK